MCPYFLMNSATSIDGAAVAQSLPGHCFVDRKWLVTLRQDTSVRCGENAGGVQVTQQNRDALHGHHAENQFEHARLNLIRIAARIDPAVELEERVEDSAHRRLVGCRALPDCPAFTLRSHSSSAGVRINIALP